MIHEELLKKYYLDIHDIMALLNIGENKAREVANDIQEEMKQKKYYIPQGRKKVVLTKIFKKRYGL